MSAKAASFRLFALMCCIAGLFVAADVAALAQISAPVDMIQGKDHVPAADANVESGQVPLTSNTHSDGKDSATAASKALEVGRISVTVNQPSIPDSVEELIGAAKKDDKQLQICKEYIERYASKRSKVSARAGDALNSILMFRGISTSCEAGDVLLDEQLKLKSLGSAKYIMRKLEDQVELAVLTSALDLVATLGNKDTSADQQLIADRRKALEVLAGPEATARFVACIQSSSEQLSPGYCSPASLTSHSELEKRIQLAVQCAALNDQIVDEVRADIHKFNHHSTAVMAAHRIARTTLSVISLAPNVAGPAAQAVLFGYVVISGGSESSKVLKELYMGKRLQCRVATLTEEMHTLFDGYRTGANGANNLLCSFSEQILADKMGAAEARMLLKEKDYSQVKIASNTKIDKRLKEAGAASTRALSDAEGTVAATDEKGLHSNERSDPPGASLEMQMIPIGPELVNEQLPTIK